MSTTAPSQIETGPPHISHYCAYPLNRLNTFLFSFTTLQADLAACPSTLADYSTRNHGHTFTCWLFTTSERIRASPSIP